MASESSVLTLRLAFATQGGEKVIVSIGHAKDDPTLEEIEALGEAFITADPFLGIDFTQLIGADLIERIKRTFIG
jgi:hypothetical protein